MGFCHPYEGVDWETDERRLAQLHAHEPRNAIRATSSRHEPTVDAERVPIDAIGKNDLSPAPAPAVLAKKYRYAGYSVFALTEHEYYVDGEKRKETPYEECPGELDRTSQLWADGAADPADLALVTFPGTELRGTLDGSLQDVLGLDTAIGHGREDPMGTVLDRIAADDGLAVLPHPSKYHDPDEYDAYVPLFEGTDALLGLEVFNASDRYPSRALWDRLLAHFGAERPVWAFAGDDYHARARPGDAKRFDRSRLVLLVPELSEAAVREALVEGRSYVQFNGDRHAPFIEAIDVTAEAITVTAPDATEVAWIASGERVARGETVRFDRVADAPYVRAEARGAGRAVTCTQPFYVV